MTKIIVITLAASAALALAACSPSNSEETTGIPAPADTSAPATTEAPEATETPKASETTEAPAVPSNNLSEQTGIAAADLGSDPYTVTASIFSMSFPDVTTDRTGTEEATEMMDIYGNLFMYESTVSGGEVLSAQNMGDDDYMAFIVNYSDYLGGGFSEADVADMAASNANSVIVDLPALGTQGLFMDGEFNTDGYDMMLMWVGDDSYIYAAGFAGRNNSADDIGIAIFDSLSSSTVEAGTSA